MACMHTPNSHCGSELQFNNPVYDDNILVEQHDKITLSNITKEPRHAKTMATLYRNERKGLVIVYSQSARLYYFIIQKEVIWQMDLVLSSMEVTNGILMTEITTIVFLVGIRWRRGQSMPNQYLQDQPKYNVQILYHSAVVNAVHKQVQLHLSSDRVALLLCKLYTDIFKLLLWYFKDQI